MKKKIHDLVYECYENVKDPFNNDIINRKDKKNSIKKKTNYEEKKKEKKNLKKNISVMLLKKKNEINLLSFQFHQLLQSDTAQLCHKLHSR